MEGIKWVAITVWMPYNSTFVIMALTKGSFTRILLFSLFLLYDICYCFEMQVFSEKEVEKIKNIMDWA